MESKWVQDFTLADENALELILVIFAQLCEYSKKQKKKKNPLNSVL